MTPSTRRSALKIVAFAVAALVTLLVFRTERRVDHDPAFCGVQCHHDTSAKSASWHQGANGHVGVECQGCHTTSATAGVKLLLQSWFAGGAPPKHGVVDARACTSCHEKRPAEFRLVSETQGHREHRGAKGVDCTSCHASGEHVDVPAEQVCTKCHTDERLHKAATAGAETCLSCHSFAASAKNVKPPTTAACETCHASATALAASVDGKPVSAMKDVNSHALHGGVACQLCHNAHGRKPKVPEGQPVCVQCHKFENFQVGNEARAGPEGHRNCEGCHQPHAPLATATQRCIDCHEKNARGLAAGTPDGKTTALEHKDCASCHVPHTWKAERSGCMQCHKDEAALFTTRSPPQHESCTSCHDIHGPPPSGAVCLKCHSDTKGKHVALAPEKHKDCISCHNPHAPKPEDTRRSCATCHKTELAQVMGLGPEGHVKESCFGCHQPHENPLPKANVCATCHAERAKVVATAAPPKHRTCTSCHEKHVFKIADTVATCSKCHGAMFDAAKTWPDTNPHQGACKGCHTIHGSPGVAQAACFKCHGDVATTFKPPNPKHAVCRSCHEPHTPAKTALARCKECHEDKAAIAAKWPPASAHAQACNSCHQQHDVKQKKACAECHAPEVASAAGSKHQCMQCHPPHGEPPGKGPMWWARCASCHAEKAASVKARGPTHSECKNCHQQHRFAVPQCTTCHSDMPSKGIHASPTHLANCNKCHDPHVKSLPTRQQCLSCHTNRTSHEPAAERCQACHTFR